MLEAIGISVRLGGRAVLRDVTLSIRAGEIVVVAGPNGAGKSTLLACLSGALRPDGGAVLLDGVAPADLPAAELARRRAVLEQTPVVGASFLLRDLVGLAIPRAVPPEEARLIEACAIATLGLDGLAGRPIDRLSGGERHRAHMARALAQLHAGPRLGQGRWLLLDEPTASLDFRHQAAVMRAARQAAAQGAGVLAILHDLTLAAAFADRMVLMDEGRIVAEGPPQEVVRPDLLSRVYDLPIGVTETASGILAVAPAREALTLAQNVDDRSTTFSPAALSPRHPTMHQEARPDSASTGERGMPW